MISEWNWSSWKIGLPNDLRCRNSPLLFRCLAAKAPSRTVGVFFFACNMDPSGVKPFEASPTLDRCSINMRKTTPSIGYAGALQRLHRRRQPDAADATHYAAHDLAKISVPVLIVLSKNEFIKTRTRRISSPGHSVFRIHRP
jgi:hypothetical protein